jgi:RNA-directed DNA polymerase
MVAPDEGRPKCGTTGGRKSEHPTVPMNRGNWSRGTPGREGRCRVGRAVSGHGTAGGKDSEMPDLGSDVSTKQQRIAHLAKQAPDMVFVMLAHHIDVEWLREAYRRTRKDAATGVDGQTAEEYAANLEENLRSLLDRAKSGRYRAPPVRRVHIPKGSGSETRPIGIPTFEDKVLQRAVVMVLESVYEQDFLDCSYGFRPGRSQHGALEALWKQQMAMGGGWVLEVDIRKFFDTIDHVHIQTMIRQRVRDGVLVRLIGKWLNAGVLEDGTLSYPEEGSPQGGVVSPLLANIYLHEVLDKWFEHEVKPRLKGRGFLVRFADDAVFGFSSEDDARRVRAVLDKRFAKYGLTLHPDKTRLVPFRAPRRQDGDGPSGDGRPGTFDFLGFTHYWGRTRRGRWCIKRRTASDRFGRALRRISDWCRRFRHEPLAKQHESLSRKLKGHFGYYGVTGNSEALSRFRYEVQRIWHKWLARRSQRPMTWDRFNELLKVFRLPPPIAVHSAFRRGVNLTLPFGAKP